LIAFHHSHGKKSTVTAIRPPGRYGAINIEGTSVTSFQEKPAGDGAWINGGFFVLDPSVLDLIVGDQSSWESTPLMQLAAQGELQAYQHQGFWQALDTLRDKTYLENLWTKGNPPWKVWA
jgi:glucose-1-phosphate cytidylyltransferase